jgi:hypothetical protein
MRISVLVMTVVLSSSQPLAGTASALDDTRKATRDGERGDSAQVLEQEARKLKGIWQNEALAKQGADDLTRLLLDVGDPEEANELGLQLRMAVKIWNKDKDGGGGRTVMLVHDNGKRFFTVGSAAEKYKELPAKLPYRFEGDTLILSIEGGQFKGDYLLKKKW